MPQDLNAAPLSDAGQPEPPARPEAIPNRPLNCRHRQRRRKRWSWRSRLFILVGFAVIVGGGLFLWRYLASYESTDDAQVDAHLHPVSARIRGHVIRVNVDDNEYVKQGNRPGRNRSERLSGGGRPGESRSRHRRSDRPIAAHRRADHHDDTSSQLDSAAADVDKNRAAIVAAEKQLAAASGAARPGPGERRESADTTCARYKMLVDEEKCRDRPTTRRWQRPKRHRPQ